MNTRRRHDPVELLALITGRVSRLAGAGAGSSLPGLVLERLSPRYVARRAAALPDGVVVVSGTNGKTTTASMIRAILRDEGWLCVGNDTGANLHRGIATALLEAPASARIGVFEIDEGALAGMIPMLQPRLLVLTNVFRDQLDRFGDTESVAALLGRAAEGLSPGGVVIANADDPLLWHAVEGRSPIGFGVEPLTEADAAGMGAEPEMCPVCGGPLDLMRRSLGHLGAGHCPACGWSSQPPAYLARVLADGGVNGVLIEVSGTEIDLPVGGIHNAYNAAAAIAAVEALGIPAHRAATALEAFHPRFGRAEELTVDGRRVLLELMKNPAGAGALVEKISSDPAVGAVVVSISDQTADGRDISWIYDADFERLAAAGLPMVATGRRWADAAVRLKYAGVREVRAEADPLAAVRVAATLARSDGMVVVLATYTAMLDLRSELFSSRREAVVDAGP